MANARYFFLPYLRRGMANAIRQEFTEAGRARAPITIRLGVGPEGGQTSDVYDVADANLRVMGPGEVAAIDTSLITRVEPAPLSANFSPNYFCHVEFAVPDLPWMFSPYRRTVADDSAHRLLPWFVLIAVPKSEEDGGVIERMPGVSLPVLRYTGAQPQDHLPKLDEAWAWAHVQLAIEEELSADLAERTAQIKDIVNNKPDHVVARLMCPRQLLPGVTYNACLVPTFRVGVQAGLGQEIDADPDLQLAWSDTELLGGKLPVYHSWEFTTAEAGDFEALVRRLEPRKVPKETGLRDMDIGRPGLGMPVFEEEQIIRLEGALWAPDAERSDWPGGPTQVEQDEFREDFQSELQLRLDAPANLTPTSVNPTVAPPLYGRWYAARDRVPDPLIPPAGSGEQPVWFRELNLDARERSVAGFGTRAIQREQEQLMHMAWQQIGDIKEANRLLIRTQFAREVNLSLYRRIFQRLPLDWLLAITWRLHWRIFINGESLTDLFGRCSHWGTAGALGSPWTIRFLRPGGPLGGPFGGGPTGGNGPDDRPRHLPIPGEEGGDGPEDGVDDILDPIIPVDTHGCVCDYIHGRLKELGPAPELSDIPDDSSSVSASTFGGLPMGDLTQGGLATASHQDWPLEDADKLFDNNPNTRWRAPFTKSPWVKYVLSDLQHRVVTSYAVTSANDNPDRDPKNWTFEGSQDGLIWTVLDTRTNFVFTARLEEHILSFTNAIAYSHYRLNISDNRGSLHTQLAELQFFEDASLYDDLSEGGTASASSQDVLFPVSKLFDDNAGTKWIAEAATGWARYSFVNGREQIVTSYALISADDHPERDPKNWTLEGSHDGTTWVVLDTQTNISFVKRYEKKAFAVDNIVGFAHYRLNVTANHGGSKLQLAELYLLGVDCEDWPLCQDAEQQNGCKVPTREDIDEIPPNDDFEFPQAGGGPGTGGQDSADAAAVRDSVYRDADYVTFISTVSGAQTQASSCTIVRDDIRNAILAFIDPELTSVRRARARIALDETLWDPADPLHSIMAHPKIDKPMYASLPDQDLLPGLDKIPPDTITLLRTNPRFIEAFLVGLNHEFGREMLWREYPTDQRGTVFRQFWDVAGRNPKPATPEAGYDIPEVVGWNPSFVLGHTIETFGANSINIPPGDGQVVLLIRGELLRRYPTADIYAVKAEWSSQTERRRRPTTVMKQPIFRGNLDPDVTFFGFDLRVSEAAGLDSPTQGVEAGWYFAIQQQPFEPRFGLDVADFTHPPPALADRAGPNPVPGGNPWNALSWIHLAGASPTPEQLATVKNVKLADFHEPAASFPDGGGQATDWGRNSSNMAEITWQLPVRIMIHAEDMLSLPGGG